MTNRYQKIRASYDELAYVLSLLNVNRYMFFEKQSRSIGIEQAVPIINDMIRKKWIVPGKEKYTLSAEWKSYAEHIKCPDSIFAVRTEYNRCHDLLCYIKGDSVLSVENDYNKKEHVLLCMNDIDSFLEMLDEEGYLRNIVPVDEEDRNDAERLLALQADTPDILDGLKEERMSAMLSFEKISASEETENRDSEWLPEDPFADDDTEDEKKYDREKRSGDRRNSGIYICSMGIYPYIAVETGAHRIRVPYNKKNLKNILSGWMMEEI